MSITMQQILWPIPEHVKIALVLYCDKTMVDPPVTLKGLKELSRRMRTCGLLIDSELDQIENLTEELPHRRFFLQGVH